MIIAFEGIDGAGKNTLVTALEQELLAREIPVAKVAFPRYDDSIHAQLAAKALRGEMGDLIDSTHGMATLFALDRAEVGEEISSLDADGYVVLIDRYVSSNAAYSAAREGWTPGEPISSHPMVQWLDELEIGDLGVPVPDLHILVATDPREAAHRARSREQQDSSRALDAYEKDADLQTRTYQAYRALAEENWLSPWITDSSVASELALDAGETSTEESEAKSLGSTKAIASSIADAIEASEASEAED